VLRRYECFATEASTSLSARLTFSGVIAYLFGKRPSQSGCFGSERLSMKMIHATNRSRCMSSRFTNADLWHMPSGRSQYFDPGSYECVVSTAMTEVFLSVGVVEKGSTLLSEVNRRFPITTKTPSPLRNNESQILKRINSSWTITSLYTSEAC